MKNRKNLLIKRRNSFRSSRNILFSFKYAINGINYCFKNERNFRIELSMACLSLILSFLLNLSYIENLILFATIFSVLILELLNTAIESLVDLLVDKEFSKLASISKDCAAGAVLLASINSIFVALYLFLPKIKLLFTNL